ncbi:MAG: B12-binding domain-containing radical SAM protein [Promethearchaeota archaeon]
MKRTRIILIQPITIFSKKFDYGNTPLNHLLGMATYVNHLKKIYKLNLKIEIINLLDEKIKRALNLKELNDYIKDLKKFLLKFNDGSKLIFGISFFSTNYFLSGMVLAKTIRELFPKSIICCGGYHVNFFPNDFIFPSIKFGFKIEKKIFDYIFLGEADKKFGDLIRYLIENDKLKSREDIPTQIINCGKIDDLDTLPMVDFSLMNYKPQHMFFIPFLFSRGCPFNCNFCGDYRNKDPNFKKKRWRMHSPEYAVKELISTANFFDSLGYKYQFLIFDPLFTFPAWRKKFYEKLINLNFKRELWAEIRIDQFSIQSEIDLLKKLNFTIAFGIESGSKKMLKIMNKTNNPNKYLERTFEVINSLNKTDTYIITNFIFGHPGETPSTLSESMDFIDKLYKERYNMLPSFAKYMLTPGSQIYYNMPYYYRTFGAEFKYSNYWMIPKCFFLTSTVVNPSSKMTYKDVINEIKPFILNKLKQQVKNLVPLKDRSLIHQRYLSNTLFSEIKHWKSDLLALYKNIENYDEIKEDTISFWKFFAGENKINQYNNLQKIVLENRYL